MSRVHGLSLIREEWPLALLSINHALLHHVDRLHCAVQISADATLAGVRRLQAHWGPRLNVLEIRTHAYLQEPIVQVLSRVIEAEAAPEDWILCLDADEFAVTPAGTPLRQLLAEQPADRLELRYRVWNWLSHADFDDQDLSGYTRLRQRALPCVFLRLPPQQQAFEIAQGFVNYFDLPFLDKTFCRVAALRQRWIGPGAHFLRPFLADLPLPGALPPELFHVIHLPLLSRRRLDLRLHQARNLQAQGFGFGHGWQSQMLLALHARNGLDDFWLRHAIGPHLDPSRPGAPCCEESDLFVAAIEPALGLTTSLLGSPSESPGLPAAASPWFEEASLRTIQRLQRQLTRRLNQG